MTNTEVYIIYTNKKCSYIQTCKRLFYENIDKNIIFLHLKYNPKTYTYFSPKYKHHFCGGCVKKAKIYKLLLKHL